MHIYIRWIIRLILLISIISSYKFIIFLVGYYGSYWFTEQLKGEHLKHDRERWCALGNAILPIIDDDINRISLILHMSADYLSDDIVEQFNNWNGPISLSIVLNDINQYPCVDRFMRSLISKYDLQMMRVHYLYKRDITGECVMLVDQSCELNKSIKPSLIDIADYPMNMARNVAREFITTKFMLISDCDLLYSEGFERRMTQLAKEYLKSDEKRVLVFRIFEIFYNSTTPRTKSDLHELIKRGEADTFHVFSAYGHHELDGREEWLSKSENFTHTHIAQENVQYSRFTWEPRFVSLIHIPYHDERFPYRIRANNVVGWELCRAGYKFSLVHDLFTFHRAKRVLTADRWNENNNLQLMNRLKFEQAMRLWYERMDREYPETKRSCPSILKNKLWYYSEE